MTQAVHHAADAGELDDVGLHQRVVDVVGVQGGIGERDTVLIQVVADRDLAAESVAAVIQVHFVVVVVIGLDQDGHIQVGLVDGVDDTDFKAEVRKRDDDAVDFLAVGLELGGHLQAVFTGFDGRASGRSGILGEDHVVITALVQHAEQFLAHVDGQVRVKVGAGADNDTETEFFSSFVHNSYSFYCC